ncbi:hypothetical protein NFI96_030599, partial [Prochilodus magdalenae]
MMIGVSATGRDGTGPEMVNKGEFNLNLSEQPRHLDLLEEYCQNWAQTGNPDQSKIMILQKKARSQESRHMFHLGDSALDHTLSYGYLGLTISASGGLGLGGNALKEKACRALYSIRKQFSKIHIPIRTWLKVFHSVTLPTALYGCTVMCVNERTFTRAPGESVLLPCPCPRSQQKINPKRVTWSKDQTPVSNDTESYRGRVWTFDQTPSRNFSLLLLSDLTEEDSGDYTCTADDHTPYVTLRIKVPSEGLWWLSLKPVLSSTGPSTIASYVGVALLLIGLIGGSALIIYKLRTRRTQGTAPPVTTVPHYAPVFRFRGNSSPEHQPVIIPVSLVFRVYKHSEENRQH